MKKYIMMIFVALATISCTQETPKVKHVKSAAPKSDIKTVKVINAEDPICLMKTKDFLTDTVVYQKQVYGFCSSHCKAEFKKNPKKYAVK